MTKADKINMLIGETIFMLPMLIGAFFIPIIQFYAVVVSMLCFMTWKWAYDVKGHAHFEKGKYAQLKCVLMTNFIFVFIGFLVYVFYFLTPLLQQPILPVIIASGVLWINANVGDLQAEFKELKKYKYEKENEPPPPPFNCKTATFEEMMIRGKRKGMKEEDIRFLYEAHNTSSYKKTLSLKYGNSLETTKNKKSRLTKAMEADE